MSYINKDSEGNTVVVTDYEQSVNKEIHDEHDIPTKTITDIDLQLVGEDGNAFAIIGRARKALRHNGRADLIEQFTKECTSGDYNNLLRTCMKYFICD